MEAGEVRPGRRHQGHEAADELLGVADGGDMTSRMLHRTSLLVFALCSLQTLAKDRAVGEPIDGPFVTVTLLSADEEETGLRLSWLVEPMEGSSGFADGLENGVVVKNRKRFVKRTTRSTVEAFEEGHPGVVPARPMRPTARVVEVVVKNAKKEPGSVAVLSLGAWPPNVKAEGASGAKPQFDTFRVRL